jgi:hypothetical protein
MHPLILFCSAATALSAALRHQTAYKKSTHGVPCGDFARN